MTVAPALPDVGPFSQMWVDAWNHHDVEGVLQHFHDDVLFTSPIAAKVVPSTGGVIRSKHALRAYWQQALQRIPDLRFEVETVHAGIDVLVIRYRNQRGVSVNEVLRFREGKVCEGHGTYPSDAHNPAGVQQR